MGKKHTLEKRLLVFIIMVFAVFAVSACEDDGLPDCSEEEIIMEGQCISQEFADTIEEVNATYTYEEALDVEDESLAIEEVEALVDKLLLHGVAEDQELVYVIKDIQSSYFDDTDKTVYLSIDNIQSFDTIFSSLLSVYDKDVNYGLIYGLATHLSSDLEFEERSGPSDDTLSHFLNDEKVDLMDLVYPAFSEYYTSDEDIEKVKAFANQFTEYIVNEEGLNAVSELLDQSDFYAFEQQYNAYLNAYIDNEGFDYEVPLNEAPIFFNHDSGTYYSKWSTSHGDWKFYNSYENDYMDRLPENFLKNYYKELKEAITIFEAEMYRIDALLKKDGIEYDDPRIIIGLSGDKNYYVRSNQSIYIAMVPALSHEYVHHVTADYMDRPSWLHEAVAHYYSYEFYYMELYMESLYFGDSDLGEFSETLKNAVSLFEDKYNREVDYSQDLYELTNIYSFLSENYADFAPLDTISFANYMVETYTEETFLLASEEASNVEEHTGKSWPTLIEDWENHIKSKYS